jgi:hypothetical protein
VVCCSTDWATGHRDKVVTVFVRFRAPLQQWLCQGGAMNFGHKLASVAAQRPKLVEDLLLCALLM